MVAVAARAFEAIPGLSLAPHFQPHGLAAVRAGTGVGQSAGDDGEEDQLARVVRDNGMNQSEIAEIFWIGRMTLYRHLEASACTTTRPHLRVVSATLLIASTSSPVKLPPP